MEQRKTKYTTSTEAKIMHQIARTIQIRPRTPEEIAERCGLTLDGAMRALNHMNAAGVAKIIGYRYASKKYPMWGIGDGDAAPPRRKPGAAKVKKAKAVRVDSYLPPGKVSPLWKWGM